MKFLLSFALVVAALCGANAHAAIANENNPMSMCVPLGSPSADATVLGGSLNGGKNRIVTSVRLLNAATIAASNTDYVLLSLKKGSTSIATLDSRAGGQGAITANTNKSLVLSSTAADLKIAANDVISVVYDETDAGTNVALTGAVLCFDYVVK